MLIFSEHSSGWNSVRWLYKVVLSKISYNLNYSRWKQWLGLSWNDGVKISGLGWRDGSLGKVFVFTQNPLNKQNETKKKRVKPGMVTMLATWDSWSNLPYLENWDSASKQGRWHSWGLTPELFSDFLFYVDPYLNTHKLVCTHNYSACWFLSVKH